MPPLSVAAALQRPMHPMDELKDRVRLIQDFDRLADRIVDRAIDIAKHYSIEEEEYYVPKVRKVLVPAGA